MNTVEKLQLHLKTDVKVRWDWPFKILADTITCPDGTRLSVQASRMHYCIPREDVGPWTHVEVMITKGVEPESWAEFDSWGTYAHVPVERVAEYIDAHGGLGPR